MLPFAGEEKIAGLLTEDLIDALSQVRALRVLSRRMSEKAGDRSASEVAAMLSVDRIIEGSVRSLETGYRVVVRLIDGLSGEQSHTERIDCAREAIVSRLATL